MKPLGMMALLTHLFLSHAAVAHEWHELDAFQADPHHLRVALQVAEELQETALAGDVAARLDSDASAAEWLAWLATAAGLESRQGQQSLGDLLAERAFSAPDAGEWAVSEWRHAMEHLALVYDATAQPVAAGEVEQILERLQQSDLPAAEAERLSYRLSLAAVGEQERNAIAPLLPPFGSMIRYAAMAGAP